MRGLCTVLALGIAFFGPTPLSAAPRTFVSATGSDGAPCTLSAPCRSFAAALVQTDANGEVVVLDSAGYGVVTIDRSVSIIAPAGIYAGISTPPGGAGITVNGAGVRVVLRNLTIGTAGGGDFGIKFLQGDELHVEGCVIANLATDGIHASAQMSTTRLSVVDSLVRDNVQGGIVAEDNVRVALDRVRLEQNGTNLLLSGNGSRSVVRDSSSVGGNAGIVLEANGASTIATLDVEASNISQSAGVGVSVVGQSNGNASFECTRCQIADNSGDGVSLVAAFGGTLHASLVDTTVTRNEGAGVKMPNVAASGEVQVAQSVLTRNGGSAIQLGGGMTAFASASISDSVLSVNGGSGVEVYGPGGYALLSSTTIFGNSQFGVTSQNGSASETRGNNNIRLNGAGNISGPFYLVPLN